MKETVDYIVGLDLGQAQDYTALAVIERPHRPEGADRKEWKPTYSVRHLERFKLGTPYTEIVPATAKLVGRKELSHPPLIVDQTGVGRAVVDMLKRSGSGSRVVPVTITAGQAVTQTDDGYHVPKKELVTCAQILFQARRIKVAAGLALAETLMEELQNFKVKITPSANETFGAWREGQHDDLVLATVLGLWWAEKHPHYVLSPDMFRAPDQEKLRREWTPSPWLT